MYRLVHPLVGRKQLAILSKIYMDSYIARVLMIDYACHINLSIDRKREGGIGNKSRAPVSYIDLICVVTLINFPQSAPTLCTREKEAADL